MTLTGVWRSTAICCRCSILFLSILNVAGLKTGLAIYTMIFLAFFFVYAWRNLQGMTRVETLINCVVFSFLTYPFLFCLDRANPEMYEFILRHYNDGYVVGDNGLYFGGSLFGMLKVMYYIVARHHRDVHIIQEMLSGYLLRSARTMLIPSCSRCY